MCSTLRLAEQLISCTPVSPDDAGCQAILAKHVLVSSLEPLKNIYKGVPERPATL